MENTDTSSEINYYDWTQPVHSDLTLTAVWDENIDPNNPTWEYLKMAAGKENPEEWYPLGTELSATSWNGQTKWKVIHYGNGDIVDPDTLQVVNVPGVYVTPKYLFTSPGSEATTTRGAYLILDSLTNGNVTLSTVLDTALPTELQPLAATYVDPLLGNHKLAFLRSEWILPGTDETWSYYDVAESTNWAQCFPTSSTRPYPWLSWSERISGLYVKGYVLLAHGSSSLASWVGGALTASGDYGYSGAEGFLTLNDLPTGISAASNTMALFRCAVFCFIPA